MIAGADLLQSGQAGIPTPLIGAAGGIAVVLLIIALWRRRAAAARSKDAARPPEPGESEPAETGPTENELEPEPPEHEALEDEPEAAEVEPAEAGRAAVESRVPELMARDHTGGDLSEQLELRAAGVEELTEVGDLLVSLHRRFGVSHRSRAWVEEVLPVCSPAPIEPEITRDLLAVAALAAGGVEVDMEPLWLAHGEALVRSTVGHIHLALVQLEAQRSRVAAMVFADALSEADEPDPPVSEPGWFEVAPPEGEPAV